jgi:hypothetical protein
VSAAPVSRSRQALEDYRARLQARHEAEEAWHDEQERIDLDYWKRP